VNVNNDRKACLQTSGIKPIKLTVIIGYLSGLHNALHHWQQKAGQETNGVFAA
jgi:hypothetical protein